LSPTALISEFRSQRNTFACEVVPKSFDNIKHIERSPIRISWFYYDTTYWLSTYDHRPSINTIQQILPPFLGMLKSCRRQYDEHTIRRGSTVSG